MPIEIPLTSEQPEPQPEPQSNTSGSAPSFPSKPIPGDGILTIEIPGTVERPKTMADPIDLPPNVASQIQAESVMNAQITTNQGRQISQMANGVLQAAMARNFDKIGTEESRAISGVLATPVAGPANTAK